AGTLRASATGVVVVALAVDEEPDGPVVRAAHADAVRVVVAVLSVTIEQHAAREMDAGALSVLTAAIGVVTVVVDEQAEREPVRAALPEDVAGVAVVSRHIDEHADAARRVGPVADREALRQRLIPVAPQRRVHVRAAGVIHVVAG